MPGLTLVQAVRVRLRRKTTPNDANTDSRKLAMLVKALTLAERAAEVSGLPYLKGAVGFALEVAQCVQGYRSNNEELNRLALTCGELMVNIADQLNTGGGLSKNMEQLVEDLYGTLEKVQNTTKDIATSGSRLGRFLGQKEDSERLGMLSRDVTEAQMKFLTLASIANSAEQSQDCVYDHSSIVLDSYYTSGTDWYAFKGMLQDTGENVIIKRYGSDGASGKVSSCLRFPLFKSYGLYHRQCLKPISKLSRKNWHPNLLQYLGRSRPGADEPYTVLRGVTSDHVSSYVALKFAEDNQRGSVEALRLLKDLTNALAFTIGTTDSSSFDISKIHLNGSGNIVVINLDPVLVVNKGSKDDMPYWRSWQEICIELLAGDPSYEPNPSIEYDADPASHRRLEYLRPILGHIHYGGARFKETSIENAFKSEGLVLSQALRELHASVHNPLAPPDEQVLRAMWRRFRELHYVAHFREPLDVDVGDVGYIMGSPPKFILLANVRDQLVGEWNFGDRKVEPLRFVPANGWTTTTVAGIVRHEFRFPSGTVDLVDWHNERPRLFKDFLLRRVNVPRESGLVVECSEAWKVLAECANTLASSHSQRSVRASNLILVVYFKQQSGYATFRLNRKVNAEQWRDIWVKDGLESPPDAIYFYESPPGGTTGVWGYFSLSLLPGSPYSKWTPHRDDAGETWGWTFQSEDWTVEISKPNIKQYIRYVQL